MTVIIQAIWPFHTLSSASFLSYAFSKILLAIKPLLGGCELCVFVSLFLVYYLIIFMCLAQ